MAENGSGGTTVAGTLATVQAANQALFESLHWRTLRSLDLHGRPHVLMRADLAHYPPVHGGTLPLVAVGRRAS